MVAERQRFLLLGLLGVAAQHGDKRVCSLARLVRLYSQLIDVNLLEDRVLSNGPSLVCHTFASSLVLILRQLWKVPTSFVLPLVSNGVNFTSICHLDRSATFTSVSVVVAGSGLGLLTNVEKARWSSGSCICLCTRNCKGIRRNNHLLVGTRASIIVLYWVRLPDIIYGVKVRWSDQVSIASSMSICMATRSLLDRCHSSRLLKICCAAILSHKHLMVHFFSL